MAVSQAMRVLVQGVYADTAARRAFVDDPDKLLAAANVSADERKALLRLHARLAGVGHASPRSDGPVSWP